MKIVAGMPVRNEQWILEKTLTDLSTYVDEIVIVDDGSIDKTAEIIHSFNKVTAIHTNPPGTLPFCNGKESDNRNMVLHLARRRKADWILQIDADEVFEDRIKDEIHDLVERDCSVKFQLCHFWDDINHFRVDGDWGGFFRYRLYKMRKRLRFSPQPIIATPRAFDRKNRYTSDIKICHYGWINPKIRERSLQRYFEVYKIKHKHTNVTYKMFKCRSDLRTDLRIVEQDNSNIKLKTWKEMMGDVKQDKFRLE